MMMMNARRINAATHRRLTHVAFLIASLLGLVVLTHSSSVQADTRRHNRDDVTGFVGSTHEELLSSRSEKRDIFADRLQEMKRQMELHHKGERLMSEQEYYKLEKKIKAHEHKVDYLDKNTDPRHLDRFLAREELMNEMHRARLSRSGDEL